MFAGEKAQAEQLLDQLAALQRTDGSIDFAFNVADGSSLQQFRSGSIAWIGLAAATYRQPLPLDPLQRPRRRRGALAARPQAVQRPGGRRPGRHVGLDPAQPARLVLPQLGRHDVNTGLKSSRPQEGGRRDGRRHREQPDRLGRLHAQRLRAGRQRRDAPARRADARACSSSRPPPRPQRQADDRRQGPRLPRLGLPGQRPLDRQVQRPGELQPDLRGRRPVLGLQAVCGGRQPDVLWAEGTAQVRFALKALGESTSVLDKAISVWGAVTTPGRARSGRTARPRSRTSTSTTCGRPRPRRAGPCWAPRPPRHLRPLGRTAGPRQRLRALSRLASASGSRRSAISEATIPIANAVNDDRQREHRAGLVEVLDQQLDRDERRARTRSSRRGSGSAGSAPGRARTARAGRAGRRRCPSRSARSRG